MFRTLGGRDRSLPYARWEGYQSSVRSVGGVAVFRTLSGRCSSLPYARWEGS